jgi:lipopolysaccharide assembly protein A
MRFLKTLFLVALVALLTQFAISNWHRVDINLSKDMVAEVNLPILVLIAYLLGLIPTMLIYRARIWSLKRRLDTQNPSNAGPAVVPNPVPEPIRRSSAPGETPLAERDAPDREATDSKAWPTT